MTACAKQQLECNGFFRKPSRLFDQTSMTTNSAPEYLTPQRTFTEVHSRLTSRGYQSLAHAFVVLCIAWGLSGCSSPPIRPSSVSGQSPAYSSDSSSTTEQRVLSPGQAQSLAVYALGLVGTPYKWGGNTPDSGFDCSGLIGYVYQSQTGTKSPRTVAGLKNWGRDVSKDQLRTGDILIFGPLKEPTHAGIYVGEDRFVHAPSSGGTVRMDKINSHYWRERELNIRRPIAQN
jgi:cell wall-associated NlpC family hydrolase